MKQTGIPGWFAYPHQLDLMESKTALQRRPVDPSWIQTSMKSKSLGRVAGKIPLPLRKPGAIV